jgi:hypothetical protein
MRAIALAVFAAAALFAAETTVIYDGVTSKLSDAVSESENLWVTLPDLTMLLNSIGKPTEVQSYTANPQRVSRDSSKAFAARRSRHNLGIHQLGNGITQD